MVDAAQSEVAAALSAMRVDQAGTSNPNQYAWIAIEMLNRLVPSDAIAWLSTDQQTRTAQMVGFPGELPDYVTCRMLLDLTGDHPMMLTYLHELQHAGLPTPRRLSDVVSDRQLRRTRTYSALLRPVNRIRQTTVVSTVGRHVISWTLNRRRMDFTDDELDRLRHLQPVLNLLDRAYSQAHAVNSPTLTPPTTSFGMTAREIEVMQHVKKGLTAQAIAHLLGVSPRTVNKHLEHSYRKLGCNNRVSALALLRTSDPDQPRQRAQ